MQNSPTEIGAVERTEAALWSRRAEALRALAAVIHSPEGADAAQLAAAWEQRAATLMAAAAKLAASAND